MDDYIKYSSREILDLRKTKTWNRVLNTTEAEKSNVGNVKDTTTYVLHATGDCDMNGRKYIALPANLDINDIAVKTKYNLM